MATNTHVHEDNIALQNPNWSAFILLVLLLSLFNSLVDLVPLPRNANTVLQAINFFISVILWADFAYLLYKAPNKRYFMIDQRGWMVLLGTFPILLILRFLWFRWILHKDGYTPRQFLSRIVINKNAQGTLLTVLFSVLVIFEAAVIFILYFEESASGGNIKSLSDAFWWAFVTVMTVGYGDFYPVTNGGRAVAVMLMIVGVALFSVITSSLANWFLSRRSDTPTPTTETTTDPADLIAEMRSILEAQEAAHQETIRELRNRLAQLEEKQTRPDSN
ncbi:MAG: potassium channel family protein [Anaerolineae bacterium]|nr:potassium channel family protein [Anaerolineae bacterium]